MKKKELLKELEQTVEQIKIYKKRMKSSDLCEDLYDAAVLKKAIIMKELEKCDKNPIVEGIKNIKNMLPKKEKTLICDYFRGK